MKMLKHSIIAAALVATTASTSMAVEHQGFTLAVDPMMMGVFGGDVHAGNTYTYDYTSAQVYNYNYGSNPIMSMPESKFTWRAELEYKKGDWGIGASYWGLNSSGNKSGIVSDGIAGDQIYSGIRLGDNSWSTDNPDNTMDWSTSNTIKVQNFDIYGIKTIKENDDHTFNLTFGLKMAKLQNVRKDHLTYNDATTATYTYDWNYESKSNLLVGPMMGIVGHFHWKKQRVVGSVSQAFIYGNVDYSSDSSRVYSNNTYNYHYSSAHQVQELIPVSEFKLKWMYDITPKVSLGLGAFASVWYNAPMAQESTNNYYGGNTESKKTVIFAGSMGSLEYKF